MKLRVKITGYIALTTAIIIGIAMTLLGASLVLRSLVSRDGEVTSLHKQQSSFASQACLEQALLNLSLNSAYGGNETIVVPTPNGNQNCTILPLLTQGSNKSIRATASVTGATTNYDLVVDATTLTRVSITEVAGF